MKQKIIVVDYTYFTHASIFSYNSARLRKERLLKESPEKADKIFVAPSTYTCMSMLISSLKKIGINLDTDDKILLACDGKDSWRKDIEKAYKATRKEERAKAKFINWDKEYNVHNKLIEKIDNNLPFFVIRLKNCEADDIVAEVCRYFSDKEIIIVSPDHDFDQLLTLNNVKIFSPHPHKSVRKCPYRILDLDRKKEIEKAYKSIMKKIEKEKTDNLVSEVLTEEDYDKREKCVSLLQLPDFIVNKIRPILSKISKQEKEYYNPTIFSPGIQKKLKTIFNSDNIITYSDCYRKFEKKLKKKKGGQK